MKNVNESGRSMVEMLGVLAIIGVLSIGGIAGYTMAMNKYRANNIVNALVQAAIDCRTRGRISDDILDGVEGIATNGSSKAVTCFNKHKGIVEFKLDSSTNNQKAIAKMVCKSLNAASDNTGDSAADCTSDSAVGSTLYYKPQS